MGRKGMKGFIKTAGKAQDSDEEATGSSQTAAVTSSGSKAAPAEAQPAAAAAAAGSEGEEDEEQHEGPESRGHMLQRHKRELLAHKKALQRSGKKSKDEVAKLTKAIEDRHAAELAALDAGGPSPSAPPTAPATTSSSAPAAPSRKAAAAAGGGGGAAAAGAAAAEAARKFVKDLSVEDGAAGGGSRKASKAQKRREKRAQEDAEREARIAEELASLGTSERLAEEAALKELLLPLGLGIKDIRPDGHCLYSSVCDQLQQTEAAGDAGDGEEALPEDYQELRELTAQYMRDHKDMFAPYLLPEDESEDPDAYYERYCTRLETTAEWGGHTETVAIAGALRRMIKVYAAGMAVQTVGEEHEGRGPPLQVCYLQHAFGLGQHYNSLKPLGFTLAGEEEEEEGGAAEEEQ